jgi:hypothetical protein
MGRSHSRPNPGPARRQRSVPRRHGRAVVDVTAILRRVRRRRSGVEEILGLTEETEVQEPES